VLLPQPQSIARKPGGRGAIAGDKIFQRFPDATSREESLVSIEGIVDAFAFLYRQPPRAWSFEVDVRTFKEKW